MKTSVAITLTLLYNALQVGSLPAYAGLTLAGILATSAHGSGDRTTNNLADTLLAVTWVDGRGRVRTSTPKDPEFKAFNGGVGVFGVVTELLLQMTPPTNTQLITVVKEDKNMMEEINRLLKVSINS
jgi:FAD/FMN-containing dehydrogenase